MFIRDRWKSKAALIMALGITSTVVLPTVSSAPAMAESNSYSIAQRYPRYSGFNIAAGTRIPVRYDKAEKIIVTPGERTDATLIVAENIRDYNGRILIPEGSQIKGEMRPANNGTRFVAEELILRGSNRSVPINATSRVITRTERITRRSDPDILKGAAVGAAAAAVLAEIFGKIDFGEVLGGAGIGALASILLRGNREAEVAVVYPERDLDLTLRDNVVLNRY